MSSKYLSELSAKERQDLELKLLSIQRDRCFICEDEIDYAIQRASLDVDHIQPLTDHGRDDPSNFGLTHSHCNRSKQAADLRVARVMARFAKLQSAVQDAGRDAPNLGGVLGSKVDTQFPLQATFDGERVRYGFPRLKGVDGTRVHESPLYSDGLSKMNYFFALVPLAYLFHDERINPRGIGASLRGLVEEFFRGRPQLHVSLAWLTTEGPDAGKVQIFDGQHKVAAQILLDVDWLPVRVFVDPDLDVLLQANTNAGTKLRQVAFDKSVQRHLGSALYRDRVLRFQQETSRTAEDFEFSEKDLVKLFSGEASEIKRYILDAVRDGVTHDPENRLRQYIDLGGRKNAKPISYSTIDRTFYSFFIGTDMLSTPLSYGLDVGENPRELERLQIVRLMNLVSEIVFEGQFDLERNTYRIENKVQAGEDVPEAHLRAYRMAKEEILYNWLSYVRQIVSTFYAFQGIPFTETTLFQVRHPDALWANIANYLRNLTTLPLWVNRNLSLTIFGGKQNYDFWNKIFTTGKSTQGQQVLVEPLNLTKMIQP
ncbi:MAG TPA: HNH endonuclease signature motif containing protein [Dehalococcoidia bacterium]|nr:HNH endonuclease signature motif containing protein [Dehalococcoidia bacterium]